MNDDKNVVTKVITKEQLMKLLVEEFNIEFKFFKSIYNSLENQIRNLLAEANSEQNVTIKLFEGITLNSKYIPERKRTDNLTGKKTVFESKIKPKANITRRYCEKLNRKYKIT